MKNIFTLIIAILFSINAISQENMRFQANIDNKNGDTLYIKDEAGKVVQEIKINPKGIFLAEFPIKQGMYRLFDGVEYAQLFLKNGYDLKMTMNAAQFDETIKFEGKGAKENNYLAQETRDEESFAFDALIALDEVSFNKEMEQKRKSDTEKLKQAGLDSLFVQQHQEDIEKELLGIQKYYAQVSANKKMNNSKAPNFDYENAAGGKTSLESLKGKYVYVDIWATWCGPCRREIPFLKQVEEKYHDKNIAFVSVSVDANTDHDKWKNFVAEKQLDGIQLYAGKTPISDFIKAFNVNSIPRFILIDPSGNVVDADAARPSESKLQEKLDALLQ